MRSAVEPVGLDVRCIQGTAARGEVLDDDQLLDAYPWPPAKTWVRTTMITTLDGAAAGTDGLSSSVSSPADQLVFNTVRRLADAVLVGAGTMRAEQYTPMRAKSADAVLRQAAGQRPAPVIAVVSASLDLPWSLPVWSQSTHQPLVLTSVVADAQRLAVAQSHADVVTLPELKPSAIVEALASRGLRRIVCEGGPRLLRDLLADDLVDEADITIAPLVVGTSLTPPTDMLSSPAQFRLVQLLEDDGYLMGRYLAAGR